jgi:hypothetical protein
MPFDPVRSRKALSNQQETVGDTQMQIVNVSRCHSGVFGVAAGAKGIGMVADGVWTYAPGFASRF